MTLYVAWGWHALLVGDTIRQGERERKKKREIRVATIERKGRTLSVESASRCGTSNRFYFSSDDDKLAVFKPGTTTRIYY